MTTLEAVLYSEIRDRLASERWHRSPEGRRMAMASNAPEVWANLRTENLVILRTLLGIWVRARRAERRKARGKVGWVWTWPRSA